MTDKDKRELKDGVISIFKRFNILDHTATIGGLRDDILRYIDSMQEEQEHFLEDAPATDYEVPKIEAWLAREDKTDTQLGYLYLYLHKPIRAEDVGQWIGHNGVIVWNEGKYKALKWEDEPLKVSLSILGDKPKKCMFTKEEFTEEDRKILCEDCEEECVVNKYLYGKEPELVDIDNIPLDPYIQYASREIGIKAHAEDYSFNIESELFQQLNKEQQKLWRKEIEQACMSGGYCGLNLGLDKRYDKEEPISED